MKNEIYNYIDHIDGLRGYAIVLVVLFHLHFKYFDYGYLGVDIFYLISGYFITQSLQSKNIECFRKLYFTFINKRLKRILPSSCLVLYLYLVCKMHEYSTNPVIFNDIYYCSLFLSNQYFISIRQDYFSNTHPSGILNYWSLSVEFQYYIIYPILLYITKKTSIYLMIILVVLSFVYGVNIMLHDNNITVYYSLLYRMFELNIGGLLKLSNYKNNMNEILLCMVLIVFPFLFHFINVFIVFNRIKIIADEMMLLCMIIICLLIISHEKMNNGIISNKIIKYIGKCSFIIYLVHYPIIELLPVNNKCLKIITIIIASIVVYEIYDKQIQKLKLSNIQMLLMNVILFLIPFVNSYLSYMKYDFYRNKLMNYNPTLSDQNDNKIMSDFIFSTISKKDNYDDRVIPLNLHNFDKPINYTNIHIANSYLLFQYFGDILCDFCEIYPKNYNPKQSILVVGDSYTIQWLWIIRKYAYVRNLTLRFIFISNGNLLKRNYELVISYFHIIIPIFSIYHHILENVKDIIIDRYKEFVFLCSKKSDIIITFANHPISRMYEKHCVCGECVARKLQRCYTINGINSTYVNFPPILNIPNYHIINVTNELCVNGICSCVIDDYLVYDNTWHINPAIVLKFYSKVENEFDKILNNEFPIIRKYNASDKCSLLIMNGLPCFCYRKQIPRKSITRDYNDYYYDYNVSDYNYCKW